MDVSELRDLLRLLLAILLTAASRVGQGRYGLSAVIRKLRHKKLLILNDEDEGSDTEEYQGLGLHAETSKGSLGAKSNQSLRGSWYVRLEFTSLASPIM